MNTIDPNKMFSFQHSDRPLQCAFTSFDKLLYSRRKNILVVVEARNAPFPSHRRRCETFILAMPSVPNT
jgi:hypothetical protein